jgi:TonB-linked SusC/RagA family outer membrane protein
VQLSRLLVGAFMLSAAWSRAALAQRPLHGTVTDLDTGAPVGDARVTVKGTRTTTATTADGRFALMVTDSAVTLEVRRIGYQNATAPVATDQNTIGIKLKATALQLGEQVVTGQATSITRQNAATDIASVSSTELNRAHSQTVENALQGKVAGAEVTANSGAPGGGMQVRMRGVTSIFGNTQPLYVVDGVPVSNTAIANGLNAATQAAGGMNSSNQDNPVNRIADLNSNDVETIDLLKGPSAAAIYGSQAANGVIVITTKRGAPGQTRFSVTQHVGTNELANKIGARRFGLADAILYDSVNYGIGATATQAMFQQSGGFQDYEQQVYGDKSVSYETDVNLSGGSENTQYYVSALDQHDNGTMYGTGYDKQSLRGNFTQLVSSKLQVRVNLNVVHSLTKRGISNNDNVNITPYFVFPQTPSFFSFQPVNGVYPYNPFLSNGTNPLQTLALFKLPEDLYRFIGSVDATYTFLQTPTQSLKATFTGGLDNYSLKAAIYAPADLYWEQTPLPGLATDLTGTEVNASTAVTLAHTYTPTSSALTATTSAGFRYSYDRISTVNVASTNLLAGQQNVNLGSAVSPFESRQPTRAFAMFGQEEVLLFDRRLYLAAGVIAQKTTNAGILNVNKLFYYPKVGASYRWPTLGPFDELKLRLSFGETGNDPLYGQKFTPMSGVTYTGQNAIAITGTISDPNLHPEREKEIEGGIDAGLFDSRVALSLTGYQKNNTDLILQASLAPITGYATHIFNGGEIRNRGVEATVSGFPIRTKDLSWLARVTFNRNVGLVMSLPVPNFRPPNSFGFAYGSGFIQVGASPSQIYGHVDPSGTLGTVGDYEPKFTLGFSSDFTYRRFNLYGLVDWRHGGDVVNITQNVYDVLGTAPDSVASAQRLALWNNGGGQSVYVQDASFVKLREIKLSYQLPDNLLRSVFGGSVSAARAELSGRNLVTWSRYAGLDPEVSNFGNQNINRGQDLAPYPPARSYFFTLSVDF